jgi:hypothetical protein
MPSICQSYLFSCHRDLAGLSCLQSLEARRDVSDLDFLRILSVFATERPEVQDSIANGALVLPVTKVATGDRAQPSAFLGHSGWPACRQY